MSNKARWDWEGRGSLVFEGQISRNTKYLNLCAGVGDVPEDIHQWTLDLRYSWGRRRTATSAFVLRACDFLEYHINSNKETLSLHLRENGMEPAAVCVDFLNGIMLMCDCAEAIEMCSWTIPPVEGEVNQAVRSLIPTIRQMETEQKMVLLSREQEDALVTLPEEAKINFIKRFTDAMGRLKR